MSKTKLVAAPLPPAHEMPAADHDEIRSIQALLSGAANKEQQRIFVMWFNKATGVDLNPYRPGGQDAQRDTDLACGKKLVGDWFYSLAKSVIQNPQR